ncbi:hypothetical protein BUALT_Bualt16G0001700 [Buddleja alternifolia]|uniref:Alkyl transferase n=1 Tax=Buddleja alternifolia TaxID=168488 RepID=A0AAV6WIF3_9LAMI|nr:hypothetical protein BUALT_Bualt16G0001700 [Buddleja alternifolia]
MLSLQLRVSYPNHINKPLYSSTHDYISTGITKFPHFSNPNSSVLKFYNLGRGSKSCAAKQKNDDDEINVQLPQVLKPELMPKHVAVIMGGNRRWAMNRGLPVQLGHRAGVKALKQLVISCKKFGVQVVSVFVFSTENWIRPKNEVEFVMSLFEEVAQSEAKELMENDVRIKIVGNRSGLPESLEKLATKRIARKIKDGALEVEDIDERLLEQHLETNGIEFSNPDLLIRTSGELRLSNYMLWQLAYTELLFLNKLFPDFNEVDLVEALAAFQQRQRRYGGYKYSNMRPN